MTLIPIKASSSNTDVFRIDRQPNKILQHILLFLEPEEQKLAVSVSKKWKFHQFKYLSARKQVQLLNKLNQWYFSS